jgi:hypothetical protein
LPGSVPERRISFQPLGHGVMALATGADSMGAAAIRKGASTPAFEPPPGPIWLSLPASSFHTQADMPQWVSLFLESLRGAQRATLTLEVHVDGFEVALNAPCDSGAKANEIAGRLTAATGVLKGLTESSRPSQDSANVLAVLAGGTFRADQSVVRGSWRLNRAFFDALSR